MRFDFTDVPPETLAAVADVGRPEDYTGLTRRQLKPLLQDRGLSTVGKVAELRARLAADDVYPESTDEPLAEGRAENEGAS